MSIHLKILAQLALVRRTTLFEKRAWWLAGVLLFVLQLASSSAIGQTAFRPRDSVRTDGLNVGADVFWPIVYASNANRKRWELVADYAWGQHYPTIEFGQEYARSSPAERGTHEVNGAYARLGSQWNMFKNGDDALLLGARYSFAAYQQRLQNITVPDAYWGNQTTNLPDRQHTSQWVEATAGFRVRLGWQVYLTLLARVVALGAHSDAPDGTPLLVPGYGEHGSRLNYNLNYYVTIKLPTRTRAFVPEPAKKR